MEFRILGPLEALDEGRVVRLGGSRQRALLAMLLLHANEVVSSDRLADELWSGATPKDAAKALSVAVARLRKALEPATGEREPLIVTRPPGYELRIAPDQLDLHRFNELVAEARGTAKPQTAAAKLRDALALWRGAPLADLAYEPFAQREIARLEDLRVAALEQLIEAKLELGAHAELVGQLEALIGEHPYRERLRAQLMLALYRLERQADALQAYQDARRTLVEELGIEPGERLRELERAILAQDPRLQLVTTVEPPPAAEPRPEAPRGAFVGRERELAELVAGLDNAFAGRGRLFLLVGEPGIGKSRLADELVAQAGERGARVLVGRCWEAGGAPAYWPWVQSLRAYVRETDSEALRAQLGADAADLAQVLPELRERLPDLQAPPSLESEAARFRLFDAMAAFLQNASAGRPIVLVLDDLHAADASSLLLLRFLARQLGSTRILLLCAYRDVDPLLGQPLTEMLVEVAREPATCHLPLGGLDEREVAEYVELTAPEIASPGLTAALEEDGNPLFVGEIVRLLSAEGVRPGSSAELRLALPQSVRDVIARRLSHLSEECSRVLVLASVLGREFPLDALARLAGVPEDELLEVLDEAMAARVVSDVPGAPERLRFAHVLIRDTLYDELAATRRLRLHREVGEVLEALHGSNLEPHLAELAHHYLLAGATAAEKASRYAAAAGDRAASQFGYEEAARHYRSALRVLETSGARDERTCELLLSLGDVLSRAGSSNQAKQALRRAAAIAEREGWTDKLARAALGYGGRFAWARAGSDPALVPLLERALAAVAQEDSAARVRLLARLAAAMRDDPSRDRRVALAEEAVGIARRSGDPSTLAYALEGYWLAVEGPDSGREGIVVGNQLVSLGEQIGDKECVFSGRDYRLGALWNLADRTGIDVELDSLTSLADELRQPAQLWYAGTWRTMLALTEGRFQQAEQLISETLALGQRAENWHAPVSQRLQLFVLRRAQGRLAELEQTIRRSIHEYPALLRFRCALAHLHGQLGREREARTVLDDLLSRDLGREHVDSEWLFAMCLLPDPCASLGHDDAAATIYSLLLPYKDLYVQAPAEASFGSVARVLGVLATRLRGFDDAQMHFETAVEKERMMGGRPWLAHTQHDHARMLLARAQPHDGEQAHALIAQALATYRELGMQSWAEDASKLERRLRVRTAPGR